MTASEQSMMGRIKGPIVWAELDDIGVRIEDLQQQRYERALEVIKKHYMNDDVLCRCVNIKDDPVSTTGYLTRLKSVMKDCCSIIAVSVVTGDIVAVLVQRTYRNSDFARTFSHVKLMQGEKLAKILNITYALVKRADIWNTYGIDGVLRFYVLCVVPKFRKKGLGIQLMRAGVEVARCMKMEAVMSVFSTGRAQYIAKKVGFQVLYEISYVDWIIDGEMVFDDPGAGNYTVALVAIKL